MSSTIQHLSGPKKAAVTTLFVALAVVAVLAAVATFPAALSAAQTIGLPRYAAIAWACLPDVGVVVGMLGALVLTDPKGRRFAIGSVVAFGLSSAMVNISHAVAARFEEEPVALLVAYGAVATVSLILSVETASRVAVELVPALESKPVPPVEPKPTEGAVKGASMPKRRSEDVVIEQARKLAKEYARTGKKLTVSAMQSELRLSWNRASRVHSEVTA
jgi:hypothetical protein